jgi:hydrogenase expression/formation protein HypC
VLLVSTFERDGIRFGLGDYGGVRREVCLHAVPDAVAGDYVIVHVGFALSVLDAEAAARTLAALEEAHASFDRSKETAHETRR